MNNFTYQQRRAQLSSSRAKGRPAVVAATWKRGKLGDVVGRCPYLCQGFPRLLHRYDRRARIQRSWRPSHRSDTYAVWLDDVLDHFSVDSASIVGVSLGGWLALDYAIRRQARVKSLAVICPGGIGRQKVGIVLLTLWFRMFGRWGKRKLTERILGRPPVDPPPPVKACVDFVALIHRHFRPRMVKLPVFTDIDLRNLKTPVLAIVGARDVLLDSAQTKRRLERHSPNVQVVYLPDAGQLIANQTLGILEFMQAQIREDGEMAGRGATTAEVGITLKAAVDQ